MGVRAEWSSSNRHVVYIAIEYPWTWEEYRALLDVLMPEVAGKPHPVATIVDISRMKMFPPHGNVMQNMKYIEQVLPRNVFGSVVVNPPASATAFMNVTMKIRERSKEITMFADSVAEAYELLAERFNELYPNKKDEDKFSSTTG
jgi:hypothetical protein